MWSVHFHLLVKVLYIGLIKHILITCLYKTFGIFFRHCHIIQIITIFYNIVSDQQDRDKIWREGKELKP